MATYCVKMEAEPVAIKAYLDGLGIAVFNIVEIAIYGQEAIIFVDGV